MGKYATTTSISELNPFFLKGNTTTSDSAGTSSFSRHITRAEGVVDAYVGARYAVDDFIVGTTTTNVPPILRTLAEDCASYYSMRGSYVQDGQIKQQYLDAYLMAKDMLQDIRDGKLKLMDTNGAALVSQSSLRFASSTEGHTPVFDMDTSTCWSVDPDKVDDMESDRSG